MIDQIGIFSLGIAAVILTNMKDDRWRRWAPICGFLAEPFWFYTGVVHAQYGIVALAFVYGIAWANGIRNYWWKKADAAGQFMTRK